MAQTSSQTIIPHVKPITLTILPTNTSAPVGNNHINLVSLSTTEIPYTNHIQPKGQRVSPPLPNFNYTHDTPIIVPRPKMAQSTPEEREALRAQKLRESSYNYQVRVREYKKLGSLRTEKEKITKLLLLCYPSLEAMPSYELDRLVTEFIQRLGV